MKKTNGRRRTNPHNTMLSEPTMGLAQLGGEGSRAKWVGDTLGLDDVKGAAHTHQRSSSPLERVQNRGGGARQCQRRWLLAGTRGGAAQQRRGKRAGTWRSDMTKDLGGGAPRDDGMGT